MKLRSTGRKQVSRFVIKSISLPEELCDRADSMLASLPDMTFSRYIRELLRADLCRKGTKETTTK